MQSGRILVSACAAATACGSGDPEPPAPAVAMVEPAPPALDVVFERVLGIDPGMRPLFGPEGAITLGAVRWSGEGRYLGRHAWAIDGKFRPVAVAGTSSRPVILALGWNGGEALSQFANPDGDDWLVAAEPSATTPTTAVAWRGPFDARFELSPDRRLLASIEDDAVVVRAVASGAVVARAKVEPGTPSVACWVDGERIAWLGPGSDLKLLAIPGAAVSSVRLALRPRVRDDDEYPVPNPAMACDPAGGAAAIAGDAAVAVVDLASGTTLASLPIAGRIAIAVGDRGRRFAIATERTVSVYRRDGGIATPIFARTAQRPLATPNAPLELQFSPDGTRLAVAGASLVVIGPVPDARARPPAPDVAVTLPREFVDVATHPVTPNDPGWRNQLPPPTGWAALPRTIVHAMRRGSVDVVAVMLERDEFGIALPTAESDDAAIAAFAKRAMPRVFDGWLHAEIGSDAGFTVRVGRRDGKPWFEARELWRDGCEPYDGYTQVVVDRDVVYVVRAMAMPGGSIKGWLATFFDLAFHSHVRMARRRGPESGPC